MHVTRIMGYTMWMSILHSIASHWTFLPRNSSVLKIMTLTLSTPQSQSARRAPKDIPLYLVARLRRHLIIKFCTLANRHYLSKHIRSPKTLGQISICRRFLGMGTQAW